MSDFDPTDCSEHEFESRLLEAGRVDPLPRNVQIAWANFAATVANTTSLLMESVSGMHSIQPWPSHHAQPGTELVHSTRAGLDKAARWLLLGALGGSALTVMGFWGYHRVASARTAHPAPQMVIAQQVALPKTAQSVMRSLSAGNATSLLVPAPASAETSAVATRQKVVNRLTENGELVSPTAALRRSNDPSLTETSVASSESNLAAEVSRLDAARRALRAGACNEAIRVVVQYHRDFPQGVLAPDADVLAIEAYAKKSDFAAARQRAEAFMTQYPNDPHTHLVQRWVSRQ